MSKLRFVIGVLLMASGVTAGNLLSPLASAGATDSPMHDAAVQGSALIELHYDQVSYYQDWELRWLDLQDSRCPIGVNCVWGGQTLATVEITKGDESPVQVKLLRRAGRDPEVSWAFEHELRLLRVEPHPKDGITFARSEFRLQLEITAR